MNIRIALSCLIALAVVSGVGAQAATPLPIDTADTRLLARLYADAEVGDLMRVLAAMEALPRVSVVQLHDEKRSWRLHAARLPVA